MPTVGKNWIGQSATIGFKRTGDSVYTLVNGIETITPPDGSYGNVELPLLANTFKKRRPTILDPGNAGFTVEFDYEDTSHQELKTLYLAAAQDPLTFWQITAPDGTTCTWQGWLTKFTENEYALEDVIIGEGEIVVNTVPVYVAGMGG